MRIALTSDRHHGITKIKTNVRLMQELREEHDKKPIDVIIDAGDYSGQMAGSSAVGILTRLTRKYFPDTHYLSTIGNHEYWCGGNPGNFDDNVEEIENHMDASNVHFLDRDGIWQHPDFPTIAIFGCSGWYANPNPPTNDRAWIAPGSEHIHNELLKMSHDNLGNQLDALDKMDVQTKIFVSHFPVINTGDDYKGAFADFCWSESLGDLLRDEWSVQYFLNGHSHQYHNGPLRYEAGSDYYNPKYLIIEV